MNADEYIQLAAASLRAEGFEDCSESWAGTPTTILRRATFKLKWFATTLHTFIYFFPQSTIESEAGRQLAAQCVQHAKAHKGGFPLGFQNGIAVIPVMLSRSAVSPEAIAWATGLPERHWFVGLACPVVVDLMKSRAYSYRDPLIVGSVYDAFLKGIIQEHLAGPLAA